MKSILNKIAILAFVTAAFTAAVRYQDQLNKIESEVVTVSKQTLDSVAVHSDVYKAKALEAETAAAKASSAASEAASAAAEAAALRKELDKAKEPITTKVVAWFKR